MFAVVRGIESPGGDLPDAAGRLLVDLSGIGEEAVAKVEAHLLRLYCAGRIWGSFLTCRPLSALFGAEQIKALLEDVARHAQARSAREGPRPAPGRTVEIYGRGGVLRLDGLHKDFVRAGQGMLHVARPGSARRLEVPEGEFRGVKGAKRLTTSLPFLILEE